MKNTKFTKTLFQVASAFCFLTLSAQAVTLEEMAAHRDKVLSNRVIEILGYRSKALKQCGYKGDRLSNLESKTPSELIHLYSLTEKLIKKSLCKYVIQAQDAELAKKEEAKFKKIENFLIGAEAMLDASTYVTMSTIVPGFGPLFVPKNDMSIIFAELRPFCATKSIRSLSGNLDTNPCFAGHGLIHKEFRAREKSKATAEQVVDAFLDKAQAIVDTAKEGSKIDFFSVYLVSDPTAPTYGSRKFFLGMMTYLYAASTSFEGYVDGLGDYFWKRPIALGQTSEQAHQNYIDWKVRKDRFNVLLGMIKAKEMKTYFGKKNATEFNRHNVMSSYLACYYHSKNDDFLASTVPVALGFGYESKDFKSHIDQGLSYEKSMENFETDTNRYKQGVRFGKSFCNY